MSTPKIPSYYTPPSKLMYIIINLVSYMIYSLWNKNKKTMKNIVNVEVKDTKSILWLKAMIR